MGGPEWRPRKGDAEIRREEPSVPLKFLPPARRWRWGRALTILAALAFCLIAWGGVLKALGALARAAS